MLDGLLLPHIQTVSDKSATMCEGSSVIVSPRWGEVSMRCAISVGCRIPVSNKNIAYWSTVIHQRVSGGDVNICILS